MIAEAKVNIRRQQRAHIKHYHGPTIMEGAINVLERGHRLLACGESAQV